MAPELISVKRLIKSFRINYNRWKIVKLNLWFRKECMLLASLLFFRPPTVSFIFSFFNRRFTLFYFVVVHVCYFLNFFTFTPIVNLWIRFCFCRELQIKASMQSILYFVWSISNPFLTPSWGTGVWSQKRHICHFKVSSDKQKIQKILSAFFLRIPKASSRKQQIPEAFR